MTMKVMLTDQTVIFPNNHKSLSHFHTSLFVRNPVCVGFVKVLQLQIINYHSTFSHPILYPTHKEFRHCCPGYLLSGLSNDPSLVA